MQQILQSNINENEHFLNEVFRTKACKLNKERKAYLNIRAIKDGQHPVSDFIEITDGYLDKITDFAKFYNKSFNIYYGISARGEKNNGTKENCVNISALYLDIDYGEIGHKKSSIFKSKEETLLHIKNRNFIPSVIIDTGHGFHLYWILKEPYEFNTDNRTTFEKTLTELEYVFGADSTHNIDRVLRLPGTINHKNEPKVECRIISSDYSLTYSFDEIKQWVETDPIFNTKLKNIKSADLTRNIFGFFDTEVEDRSTVDQSIITSLLSKRLSEEQIVEIFEHFPTTGKYLERKATDEKGAKSYLLHSIENAKTYLAKVSEVNNSNELVVFTTGASCTGKTTVTSQRKITVVKDNASAPSENVKMNNEILAENNYNDLYFINYDEDKFGYYKTDLSLQPNQPMRLSNFVIQYDKQISMKIDRNPLTVFEGSLVFSNNESIPFNNMVATLLGSSQKLKEYLLSLAGVKVQFFGNGTALCEAIKHTNCDIQEEHALEFGYNENHDEYVTPNYIITADNIIEKTTPIMYSENWKGNILGFKRELEFPFECLLNDILDKFFVWDDPQVTLPGLAFTLLPIIYPFISASTTGKPFLMLQGTTGCGKTTLSRWLQHFYGDFNTLTSWTSTSTSLNVIGNAFKDTMIVLDDFKKANFYHEGDVRKAMLLLQNYSDGSARSRANVELKVRDDKPFKGFILLSAEDIVITQPSTLARGIVDPVAKKPVNHQLLKEIDNLSKSFSHFTLRYIQYILGLKSSEDFESALMQNKTSLNNYVQEYNLEGDNLPRITNNFAILKTSWDYVFRFLKSVSVHPLLDSFNDCFQLGIKSLLMENFKRTQTLNPEELYENALWELISNDILALHDVDSKKNSWGGPEDKIIGFYQSRGEVPFKMTLKFTESFRKIETYLRDQGGLGISSNTLKTKLAQLGKINLTSTGRVEPGGQIKQHRGVYWTGPVPIEIMDKLGLRLDKPTQINNDLFIGTNYKDDDFIMS